MLKNRPTHGIPLTDAERAVKRAPDCPQKGWQAGARFIGVSKFGSAQTNTGVHKKKKANKPARPPERKVVVPRWARKYAPQAAA